MSDFGDIELADVWDADPTIDPLQVAMRLHRLRREVSVLVGIDLAVWRDLPRREIDYMLTVADAIIDWIAGREPDNPATLARHVHESTSLGNWDNLPPDEQQIAIDLLDLIIDWLDREGPR